MVEIKNDLLAATEQSSMLASAISELDNSNSVTKDTQSKISGNEKAAETIENWYRKTEHKRHLPITIYDDFWK